MLGRVVALAALGGFLFGYDLGLIGGAILGISQAFNTSNATKEAIVGAAKLGAFFGAWVGGLCMLRYGRRRAISLQAAFFVAGPVLMAAAPGPAALIVGRLLVGLGIGASAIVVPAYLAEIAPAKNRGLVVQMYEVMLTLGMLAAVLANLGLSATAGASAWRWMVGLPAIPGACLLISLVSLPESPRWLVMRGQLDQALATLHTITASSSSGSSQAGRAGGGAASKRARQRSQAYRAWALQQQQQQRLGAGGGLQLEEGLEAAEDAEWLNAAPQAGRPRTAQQQALEAAEDELLLLWSSVQKELNAGLELRQSAAGGGGAGAAAAAGGAAAGGADAQVLVSATTPTAAAAGNGLLSPQQQQQRFAVQAAPAAAFSLDDEEEQQQQQQEARLKGAAAAAAAADTNQQQQAGGAADGDSSGTDQQGSGGAPSRLQALQHKLHLGRGRPAAGEDGQQQLLLSPGAISSSSNSTPPLPAGQQKHGQQPQQPPQQHPPVRRLQVEPGRESNLLASLWAMLCDIKAVARGPERAAFAIACCLAVFDQATASTAIINYAPEVLNSTMGVQDPNLAILYPAAIALAKVVGTLIAALSVDKYGRKPLLIWGGVGCALTLALTGVSLAARSVALFLAALCLFIFSFSMSWAGLYWVVVSEIFSMGAKSPATSAATSLLFLTGAAVDFVYLSLVQAIGGAAFGIFGAVAAGSAWYVWARVPETKGRTLAEIHALLAPPGGGAGGTAVSSRQRVAQQAAGSDSGSPMLPLSQQQGQGGGDTALVDLRQLMSQRQAGAGS